MNTAYMFESARNLLGWSFEYLVFKLQNYTPEFLERVHRGEPMPEVEDDLNRVYIQALAKKAVDSLLQGKSPERVRIGLTRRFVKFVHEKSIPLGDVSRLSLRISEGGFREVLTRDPDAIFVNWEGILEDIVREFNQAAQGTLFGNGDENTYNITDISLVSERPLPYPYQVNHAPENSVWAVCDDCRNSLPDNRRDRCPECGRRNSRYL